MPDDAGRDADDDAPVGEVPEGVGGDLYSKHLDDLRHDRAFGEAVLSFRDSDGHAREVAIDDIAGTESEEGSSRTKILLRNGAIVIATGAVVAAAIAAVRYRRRHH
jgi:hypothetical protein